MEQKKIVFKNYIFAALSINILTIVGVIAIQKFLPPQVPLFYGLPEGEGQLAPRLLLIVPSFASLIILTVNSILSSFIEDEFVRKALVLAGIGTTFFAVITTVKIALLVGSF